MHTVFKVSELAVGAMEKIHGVHKVLLRFKKKSLLFVLFIYLFANAR